MPTKHTTLAAELEREITEGRYGWQGGIPQASELASRWQVSINTVRNALAILEGRGIIEKRSSGYGVAKQPVAMTQYLPPAHARATNGFCRNVGNVTRLALPTHLVAKLALSAPVAAIYRSQASGEVKEGKEQVTQFTRCYILLPLSEEQIARMGTDATYHPMWQEPDVQTELLSHDEVAARPPTEEECRVMGLPEGTPVLSVLETIKRPSGDLLMVQEVTLAPAQTLTFDFPFTNKA